ncbi:MAG: hypothetical protein ACE5OW_06285 [Candidatus Bathyarchaeia archaeon]
MSKKITSIAVDEDVWRRFKGKVAEHGKTLTAVPNELIAGYLNQPLSLIGI